MGGLMPTPKPGQIRCPTCHRPTPVAAFCTQCGAAIPSSAQARPRGMDRQELDNRIRQRRPGEGRVRRGTPLGDAGTSAPAYLPFEPAPEDVRAMREPTEPVGRVDNTAPGFDRVPPAAPPPPIDDEAARYDAGQEQWEPAADADEGYPEPDDADPYGYETAGEARRGGSGMLPVIGFVVLAILALAVGAGLAGILGSGGVAEASPTPTAGQSVPASSAPSVEPTSSGAESSSTPEPTDGPVTFPDGAEITVQPCATKDMNFDGCLVDGSTISQRTMWVWIGFKKAAGSDTFTLDLMSEGQTVDQQEQELGSVVTCPGTCSGYLIGAVYRDLDPGAYELIVRRNGDFADSATFTVKG
jgi:hypothetical protein